MDAAQGVLQPDGRAVQKVDAPFVRSNGDSNQPQRNSERSRLENAEVDGGKALAVKNQVPDPLVSSQEQLKHQPDNVKENLVSSFCKALKLFVFICLSIILLQMSRFVE
jgi:hypothetical protein